MLATLFFSLIFVSLGASPVSADGAIGCLFSSVCQSDEVCVNDSLFGLCVPGDVLSLGLVPNFSIETTEEQKALLSDFLRILAKSGYTWKDDETQCAIKWLIESFKSSSRIKPPPCLSVLNEKRLPEQGQKRVSESLAHAFQSYMPQDGTDESEHIVEKYPRVKQSVPQLSRWGKYMALEIPDRPSEDSDDNDDSDEDVSDREVVVVPNAPVLLDNIGINDDNDGYNDGDDEVVIIPMPNFNRNDAGIESSNAAIPLIVEDDGVGNDDNNDDLNGIERQNAEFSDLEIVEGPSWRQMAPGLRTGGISPLFSSQFRLISTDGAGDIVVRGEDDDNDDDDMDSANKDDDGDVDYLKQEQMNKMLVAKMLANAQVSSVVNDAINADKPHHVSLVASDSFGGDSAKPISSDVKFVELNFAYVVTEPSINTAAAASAFLDCAMTQIDDSFSKALIILDSWQGKVVFEVRDPTGKATATAVAKQIESNADKIRTKCNRHVRTVGLGRGAELVLRQQEVALAQAAEAGGSVSRWSSSHAAIVALLVIASVAIAGSVVVFVLLRLAIRKGSLKHALGNVQGKFRDWKSRRQYEDLCRESIASKSGSTKVGAGGGLGEVVAAGSRQQASSPPPSPPPWAEEPRPTDLDVSTAHVVLAYMEEHLKNRSRLDEEWGELCGYAPDRSDLSVANLAENASKNRDINLVPYDHNRVKLCSDASAFKSDYINASFIIDTDPRRPTYVVTQTPLAETVADFWQLVWEQKSTLIVYLTQPNEPKSIRYWPDEGLTLYHRWQVGLVSEHAWNEDFIVRSLVLKDTATGDSRTVTQFHFLAWPCDEVPKVCRSILAFRRKANRSYRPHASPIIVQSTNGGGRAGTYVLLDMTLNHIAKGAREVDISASLEHLRDQRTGLVKTKEQFEFVLICVAEEIAAIVKSSRDGSGNSSPE